MIRYYSYLYFRRIPLSISLSIHDILYISTNIFFNRENIFILSQLKAWKNNHEKIENIRILNGKECFDTRNFPIYRPTKSLTRLKKRDTRIIEENRFHNTYIKMTIAVRMDYIWPDNLLTFSKDFWHMTFNIHSELTFILGAAEQTEGRVCVCIPDTRS